MNASVTRDTAMGATVVCACARPSSTRASGRVGTRRDASSSSSRASASTISSTRWVERSNARARVRWTVTRAPFASSISVSSRARASDEDETVTGVSGDAPFKSASTRALEIGVVGVFAATYAAMTIASGLNAFMWTLDFTNPIIRWTSVGTVIGRACVAAGATALAALNFGPRACAQTLRCARAFASRASSERLKADAAKFAVLIGMKVACEAYAYWKALTSFTPCSQSLELSAWYGVAFLGHAVFVALASKQITEDGSSTIEVPVRARKLIGAFDVALAALCAATSAFAVRGFGVASAACGVVFLAAAIFFTFEDKLPKKKDVMDGGGDDDASSSSVARA